MKKPLVHIVDDDPAVRESLQLLLDMRGFATRVYLDPAAFLANCDGSQPGCVLLDLRMPEMSGAEVQAEMTRSGNELPVLMITAHGDVAATRSAFKAGALDFIEKPLEPDELIAAVEAALDHDAAVRERKLRDSDAARRLELLTPRELQVVDRLLKGRQNREIGRELRISPRTVEVYKARAMEKLGAKRLADVIRLAMRARGEVK